MTGLYPHIAGRPAGRPHEICIAIALVAVGRIGLSDARRLKIHAVAAEPEFHGSGEKHLGACLLHERHAHAVDRPHTTQVNRRVEAFPDEALPASVAVMPSAPPSVGERGVATGRVGEGVGGIIVAHLAAAGIVGHGFQTLLPLPCLGEQVEGMVAPLPKVCVLGQCPLAEAGIVLVRIPGPSQFGNGHGTRPKHIFQMLQRGHVFGPEVALDAHHQTVVGRIVTIDALQGQIAAYGLGLGGGGILIGVEITVGTGRQHHGNAPLHGFPGLTDIAPNHRHGVGGDRVGEYLVPTHQLASVALQKTADAADEIPLQLLDVGHSLLTHALLAERTLGPGSHACLIASHMDIF